jgi:hypothetical protein
MMNLFMFLRITNFHKKSPHLIGAGFLRRYACHFPQRL